MHVQYSFVRPREAPVLASEPIPVTPSLAMWAGIVAMAASTLLYAIA